MPEPESKPSTPSQSVSDSSGMLMVDRVQAVIDSYADRVTTDPYDHQKLLKVPRASRVLTLLGLLALLVAIGFAIVYGLRSEVRRGTDEATESTRAGTSLLLTDEPPVENPIPPPEKEDETAAPQETQTQEATTEEKPEPPPTEEEAVPEPEPEPKKVKPKIKGQKRRKTSKRKKKRKRRKRRRRR